MEHNIGEYLAGVIKDRMNRGGGGAKYPQQFRVRNRKTGEVFDVYRGGYDPKYNVYLYSLTNINTKTFHPQTYEDYLVAHCDMIDKDGNVIDDKITEPKK